MDSSTVCASSARSSDVYKRQWHALRTPATTLSRLNGSVAPERLTTVRLVVSTVVKRRPHSGHWRRRRIAAPSSAVRESTTRESEWRQNGQCIWPLLLPRCPPAVDSSVIVVHNLWTNRIRVTTTCWGER